MVLDVLGRLLLLCSEAFNAVAVLLFRLGCALVPEALEPDPVMTGEAARA
jgi:hypothetical protein